MLGAPAQTPYDLNFSVFGFPVRVAPWFWVAAFIFGQGGVAAVSPHTNNVVGATVLFPFAAAMFLSILIHELGHAFAFRYFGISSYIVLYHFGGLAIPQGDRYGGYTAAARHPYHDLIISAAGPLAQLLGAFMLAVIIRVSGHAVPMPLFAANGFAGGELLPNDTTYFFAMFFLFVSVYWAILNLLPVYPLDGGQIARNLLLLFGGTQAIQHSLMLSVATGGLLAFYGLTSGQTFLGIMFGFLAYSSYQNLQAYGGGPRGW